MALAPVTSIPELITRLGQPTAFARAVSELCPSDPISPTAASEMKRRGTIPWRYWRAVMVVAAERGVSVDEAALLRLHENAKQSAPEQTGAAA